MEKNRKDGKETWNREDDSYLKHKIVDGIR